MITLQEALDRLPEGRRAYVEARARKLIAETALSEVLAPIEPMAAGEKPTGPGWYVTLGDDEDRIVRVDLSYDGGSRERLAVFIAGGDYRRFVDETDLTFIARIYPERILAEPATP
jgi:hypothetical protein